MRSHLGQLAETTRNDELSEQSEFAIAFSGSQYSVLCTNKGLPFLYDNYVAQAKLVEDFNPDMSAENKCFIGVSRADSVPFLVIVQEAPQYVFRPEALVISQENIIFLGCGERLLIYDLNEPRRLLEDSTECGFFSWNHVGNNVLMSAELELACFSLKGSKRWSAFVEPPWSYTIKDDHIELDVMGNVQSFSICDGPPRKQKI